jgi:hypothetical protein
MERKTTKKNTLLKPTLITTILLLSLTFNIFVVQAGAPAKIKLVIKGEGKIEVTACSAKGNEKFLGSFVSNDTIKLPGNAVSVKFELIPEPQYHVSAVVQDESYIPFSNPSLIDQGNGNYKYTLDIMLKQHTIEVTFSKEGSAIVPANTKDAIVFLGSTASLTVNTKNNPVTFNGTELKDFPYSILVWNITRDESTGNIIVTLRFTWDPDSHEEPNPEGVVRLWRTDLEYPKADINGDNQIDGTDVNAVANINPGTGPGDSDWNSTMDINGDEVIDNFDVNIVSHYNPLDSVWEDITDGWERIGTTNEWLVFGETDQFSLFRCR